MTKRKSYDKEFKLEAVQLVQNGKRVAWWKSAPPHHSLRADFVKSLYNNQ